MVKLSLLISLIFPIGLQANVLPKCNLGLDLKPQELSFLRLPTYLAMGLGALRFEQKGPGPMSATIELRENASGAMKRIELNQIYMSKAKEVDQELLQELFSYYQFMDLASEGERLPFYHDISDIKAYRKFGHMNKIAFYEIFDAAGKSLDVFGRIENMYMKCIKD